MNQTGELMRFIGNAMQDQKINGPLVIRKRYAVKKMMNKKVSGKTLYDRHNTCKIDWDIYWNMINSLDKTIKKNRNPKRRSRGGWKWPSVDYDAAKIFQARFRRNGLVKKSYMEIAEEFNLDMINADQFVSGIITSMIRYMNGYSKRSKWMK